MNEPNEPKLAWKPDGAFAKKAQELYQLRTNEIRRKAKITIRTNEMLELFKPERGGASFIEKYVKQGAPFSLWPDAEGLRVDLGPDEKDDAKKDEGLGIHSHIPYEYLDEETLRRIGQSHLLKNGGSTNTDEDMLELELRVATARGETEKVEALTRKQESLLADDIKKQDTPEYDTDPPRSALFYMDYLPFFCEESLARHGKRIPVKVLQDFMLLTLPTQHGQEVAAEHGRSTVLEPSDIDTVRDMPQQRTMMLVRILSALNRKGHSSDEDDEFRLAEDAHPRRWQKMSATRARLRQPRSVYESRLEVLYSNRRNAEMSKILTALLEHHDYSSLRKLGIETTRVPHKKGEFLVFWSDGQYERILIDPRKHIRDKKAKENYATIPAMTSADQQLLEGLLLPYVFLKATRRRLKFLLQGIHMSTPALTPEEKKIDIYTSIEGTLKILVTEVPPDVYESFFEASQAVRAALRLGEFGEEPIRRFLEAVERLMTTYNSEGSDFEHKPLADIVNEMLSTPKRSVVTFDENFIANAPADMQSDMRAFSETLPSNITPSATIVRPGKDNKIPFAMEGKVLRALNIKPAPTLLVVTGAEHQSIKAPHLIERLADSVIEVGKETRANIFMQGTLSGDIAKTIVRKYWEYRASLTNGEEPAFRLIGIEPGRSTYVGTDDYLGEELHQPYPALPMDLILSGYIAGWLPGGKHSYAPHAIGRQNIIQHASIGYPTATLVLNAGSWGATECAYSARDGFENFAVEGTGRLADLLVHLQSTFPEWKNGGLEAAWTEVKEYMKKNDASVGFDIKNLVEGHFEPLLESMLATDGRTVRSIPPDAIKSALIAKLKVASQDS